MRLILLCFIDDIKLPKIARDIFYIIYGKIYKYLSLFNEYYDSVKEQLSNTYSVIS